MSKGIVAVAEIATAAPIAKVWEALITPRIIKQYMVGTEVTTDWRPGGPIRWKGEYLGKKYEDKGVILKCDRERTLAYSHFSPLGGKPDLPANYHAVTIDVMPAGTGTRIRLTQDNNATEEARAHSAKFWADMLKTLKEVVEG